MFKVETSVPSAGRASVIVIGVILATFTGRDFHAAIAASLSTISFPSTI